MRRNCPVLRTLVFVLTTCLLATTAAVESSDTVQPVAPPRVELRGTVLDPQGEPVSGATVRVQRVRTAADRRATSAGEDDTDSWRTSVVETSDEGAFHLRKLRGGKFAVRVETEGLAPAFEPNATPGTALTVRLEPGQELSGLVLDLQTGEPIAAAEVWLCDDSSLRFGREACRATESNDEGLFRVPGLARAKHLLEAVAPARALLYEPDVAVPQPLDPETEEPKRLELFLGPGARVAGEVLAGDAEPLEQARVLLLPRSLGRRELTLSPQQTDEAGRFDFKGAPVGKYDLRVSAEGLPRPKPIPVEVLAGRDQIDLVVRFSSGSSLKLRLLDPDREPVSGLEFHVGAVQLDAGRAFVGVDASQIEAGADGRYTIRGIPPGTYELKFDAVGWRDLNRKDVTLREDETTDLGTLVLDEGGSIAGRVIDDAGEPVADAYVGARWRGPDFRNLGKHTRSAEDGRYRLSGLDVDGLLDTVKVQLPHYAPASKQSVRVGEEGVDFVLQRTGGVTGLVLLPDGLPAISFRIAARSETGTMGAEDPGLMARRLAGVADQSRSVNDSEGRFTLRSLAPGRYTVSASANRAAPVHRSGLTVFGGELTDVGTLTLREGQRVRGRVLSMEDESPVPGVVLQVVSPALLSYGGPTRPLATARSDTAGEFVFESLEPGSFSVTTEHPDFSPAEASLRLEEGLESPELVLRLGRGGTIRGTVWDDAGQAVHGARLVLSEGSLMKQSASAVADEEGGFLFDKLQPGDYFVSLLAGSGAADLRTKQATVEEHKTSVVNFGEEPPIRLRGRLLRQGEPLGGWVLLFILDGGSKTVQADSDGSFEVGLSQAGTYAVQLSSGQGLAPSQTKTVQLVVPDEPEVYRDIEIEGSSIRGQVLDADRRPVNDAVVRAATTAGSATATPPVLGRTDADGLYTLMGLEPGAYRMTVHASGFAPFERHPVVVEDGADLRQDFTLEEGRRLRGRVVGPRGRGLARALIFVARAGMQEIDSPSGIATDANGVFEVSVREGAVDLHVLAEGWAPGRAAGVQASGDPDEIAVVIALTSGGRLRVRVAGPEEEPISGAQILLRPLDPSPGVILALVFRPPRATDSSGETAIDSLAPGSYEVALTGRPEVTPVRVEISDGAATTAVLVLPAPR